MEIPTQPNNTNFSHATPLPPTQAPQMVSSVPPPKSGSDMVIKLLFLSAFILLIVVGVLGYIKFNNNNASTATPSPTQQLVVPTSAFYTSPTVTPQQSESSIEGELNAIDVGSPEADLKEINNELEGL